MSTLNIRTLILILATGLAAGCQSWPFKDIGMTHYAGNSYLEEGVQNYEEGNYRVAKRRLQFALEEGLSRPDRVKAHKYLAFIACVSSQQLACREEFAIALELDPDFELAPAEAGHPIWGPMFTNVKAKQPRQP
ncbi:MAG TPA: TssQ family T6SS-associated lipoprotein [Burkholderiales bacterium]|nr:TssQ family T6SS-associated lipoprotein [Burkholderiales bacterium]